MCVFTPMVDDVSVRFEFGWYLVLLILIGILVNIFFVIARCLWTLRLYWRRFFIRW